MAYIQKKPCKFEDCDKSPKMGCGGYCWKHQDQDPAFKRKQDKASAKKQEVKVRSFGNALVDNSAARRMQELENFFRDAARELDKNPRCEECGAFILSKYYRHATAHVLPKRKEHGFPSVASHPLNKLFLGSSYGACGCHNKFDSSWEAASQMKVWNKAVLIFKELYPLIDPSEYKNIPEILLPHIPKQN